MSAQLWRIPLVKYVQKQKTDTLILNSKDRLQFLNTRYQVTTTHPRRWCAVNHEVESVDDICGGGDLVACNEGFKSIVSVKDESISAFVLDIFN